jgi:CRISPR-associated protein Cmr6
MEKGTINVTKTSKSFAATISFEKDGVVKSLPVAGWKPLNDQYNQKPCLFKRDKGALIHLEIEGIEVLFTLAPPTPAPAAGGEGQHRQNNIGDLFQLNKTKLPKDVRNLDFRDIDNFNLKLNKAAFFQDTVKDRNGNETNLLPEKSKFIPWTTSRGSGITKIVKANYGNFPFAKWVERVKQAAQAVISKDRLVSFDSRLDWRMIVGLGNESVYETSITLHHIYGVPYIPASAVKGVFRSYIIQRCFENSEVDAIRDKSFCDVFGCPEELPKPNSKDKIKSYYGGARQGEVMFFDALPVTAPVISPDIMNPHYGEYYGSNSTNVKAPTDFLNPVPIPFFTVSDTSFHFLAGAKRDVQIFGELGNGQSIKDFLLQKMPKALSEQGIGAKTALGYGYMS